MSGVVTQEVLGERVKAARLRRGWSKEQAAREAHISAITWKRVEDGLGVQDAKRQAILTVLNLDDQGETYDEALWPWSAETDAAAPPAEEPVRNYVAAPGERVTAGAASDADVNAMIREMAELVREMRLENRELRERLARLEGKGEG